MLVRTKSTDLHILQLLGMNESMFAENDFLRKMSQIISRQVCLKGISSLPGLFSFAENDFSKHVSQVSSPKVSLHGISYLPGLFSL